MNKSIKIHRVFKSGTLGFFGAFLSLAIVLPATSALALNIADVAAPQAPGATNSALYPYPTGSLVSDGGTIYFLYGTAKIPFTNYPAFTGLGYSLKNVIKAGLPNYIPAQTYLISSADMAHPWGSFLLYVGTVYYSAPDGLIPVPSSDVFLANGGQWNLVVDANQSDIDILNGIPYLPVLALNDSRVIGQSNASNNNPAPTIPVDLSFGSPTAPTGTTTPIQSPTATTTPTTTPAVLQSPSVPQISVPSAITAGTGVSVSASSTDPGNLPLSYTFNWGDGSLPTVVSTGAASHIYTANINYTLTVTVVDTAGGTSSNTATLAVGAVQ